MLSDYWRRVRLIRREAWIVLIGYAALGFTWYGLLDAILNLYLVRMGCGLAFVGTSAAVGTLGYALISVPGVAFVRRLGGRRAMIAGAFLWSGCMIALSLADLLPAPWRQPWVLTTRFFGTSGMALIGVSNMPYLTGATTPEERPHAFALTFAVHPLGAFLGASLGGLLPGLFASVMGTSLDQPRPYGYALVVGMLVYVPVIWALWTLPEPRGGRAAVGPAPGRGAAPYALLGAMALVSLLRVAGEYVTRTFFNVYLDSVWRIPTPQIGATIALANLLTIPAPLLVPPLVERWGRVSTIVVATLSVAGCIAALAASGQWMAAAAAFVGMNVAASVARAVWMLLTQEYIDPAWRSMAAGVTNLASGIGIATMSSVGGVLAVRQGYPVTFAVGAALVALGALVVWLRFRVP
ncbi:MAG: MFS transporter [Anaerolineae bacterium]|nr:MFS transporter [Anaerolineae bacterium]